MKDFFYSCKKFIAGELRVKRALALFLMFICLVGFVNAFRFGGASLDFYHARNMVNQWQELEQVAEASEYQSALSSINTATFVHFSHPLYADLKGQILEWGVVGEIEDVSHLKEAKSSYLRAAELRPTWPVTWGSLVMIKWRMQEFDDELIEFLANADKFGPMKPEIHQLFVVFGMSLYQQNHPFYITIRDKVQNRLLLGLMNDSSRPDILKYLKQSEQVRTACRWINSQDPEVAKRFLRCQK